MSQPPIVLPISTVQEDFENIIETAEEGYETETFWVSCYRTGDQSVHGSVRLVLNERNRNVVEYQGQGGIEFEGDRTKHTYTIACPSLGIPPTAAVLPHKTYSDPLPQSQEGTYRKICAFDIAPDGSQFATGYDDGSVYIVSTTSPSSPPSMAKKCHLSTITSVRFFPSSRVLLTAGLDFALSILPADPHVPTPTKDPLRISPVRTLKGHTRAVTCTGIIARGRTIISGSNDATVRLWDVSSGAQIRTLGSAGLKPVLALSLGERGEGAFVAPPDGELQAGSINLDPREVETQDKVVFCALDDGTFQAFDLGTKNSVFHSRVAGVALNAITYSPNYNLVATGSAKGLVNVYDTRSLSVPLVSFSRNFASIEDLVFLSLSPSPSPEGVEVGLAVATKDGLPYIANVRPEGPSVRAELIGTNCDAVRNVRVTSGAVWTAGDDGVVRRYDGQYEN